MKIMVYDKTEENNIFLEFISGEIVIGVELERDEVFDLMRKIGEQYPEISFHV